MPGVLSKQKDRRTEGRQGIQELSCAEGQREGLLGPQAGLPMCLVLLLMIISCLRMLCRSSCHW